MSKSLSLFSSCHRRSLLLVLFALMSAHFATAQTNLSAVAQQQTNFLPIEEAYQMSVFANEDGTAIADWVIAPGYYLYRHAFKAWATNERGDRYPISMEMPTGQQKTDEFFGEVEVFYDKHLIELFPDNATSGIGSYFSITYQGCAEAGLCYPPKTEKFQWDSMNAALIPVNTQAFEKQVNSMEEPNATTTLIMAALFALLGGLILNLMPCVFPILSLKAMSFAHGERREHQAQSLAYAIGVIVSFIVIAGVLIALQHGGKAIGWGFQLQHTGFVIVLSYLFALMALGLSGVTEIGARYMNLGQSLTYRDDLWGSFFTGVLAVVVASPCTAPFMGTALGFALTQSGPIALVVFATLGVGMALPMVLLSYSRTFHCLLPKPGAWMETTKEILALPLYLTVVWLLWVAGNQSGVDTMAKVSAGIICLGFGLSLYRGSINQRTAAAGLIFISIVLAVPGEKGSSNESRLEPGQVAWSKNSMETLRSAGTPVFVDVTADWCITCLANEKAVLFTESITTAFQESGVVYMVADWTNYDPKIAEFVASHSRNGIPLYVMYPKDQRKAPKILPQILTNSSVLDAVDWAQ